MADLLRYKISNWDQLVACKSNNSVDLYVTVNHILNDERANGTVILINHNDFGTLFACTINCKGTIFTSDPKSGLIPELNTDQILTELEKFGFDVIFDMESGLSGDQISYLITLDELGFDKLRMIDVYTYDTNATKHYSKYIVAFDVEKCPEWIHQSFTIRDVDFNRALNEGGAMNLTYISKTKEFDWSWLTYVANIDDIIRNNSGED